MKMAVMVVAFSVLALAALLWVPGAADAQCRSCQGSQVARAPRALASGPVFQRCGGRRALFARPLFAIRRCR